MAINFDSSSKWDPNGYSKVPISFTDGSGSLILLKKGVHISMLANESSASLMVRKSSSLAIEVDPDDDTSIQFRIPSSSAGKNNDQIAFYVSGSGKVGIGTKDPDTAFDVRDIGADVDPKDKDKKTKILKLSRTTSEITASHMSATKIEATTFVGSLVGNVTGNSTGLTGTPDIAIGTITADKATITSLTASIVSSSVIYSSGSNIFGDAQTDTHLFNGHITASGDVSASGNIEAVSGSFKRLNVGVGGSPLDPAIRITNGEYITFADDDTTDVSIRGYSNYLLLGGGNSTTGVIKFMNHVNTAKNIGVGNHFSLISNRASAGIHVADTDIWVSGSGAHITASGNISASGTIFSSTGSFDYLESDMIIGHAGDPNTGLRFGSDTVIITSNNVQVGKFRATAGTILGSSDYPISMSGNKIELDGPITASGNISASGTISGSNGNIGTISFSNGTIKYPNNTYAGNNQTIDIHQFIGKTTFTGNVTASGDISSSATIYAAKLKISKSPPVIIENGHISASGNISSSQSIRALTGSFGTGTTHITDKIATDGTISSSKEIIGKQLIVSEKIKVKGSDVTIEAGHISMSGDIVMTGSLSSSAQVRALTGSFGTGTTTITDRINTTGQISGSSILS